MSGHELLTAKEAASFLRMSVPSLYAAVAKHRLPRPTYPSVRTPRWLRSELLAALDQLKALPAESVAAERNARIRRAARATASDLPTA
jgi:predicted DNA-binding transcriptional regulator AlpA